MFDDIIKHSIWIQRYAGGLYNNEILPELKILRDRIDKRILSAQGYELERLSWLMRDIDNIIAQGISKLQPSLWSSLAKYENEFALKMLDENTTTDIIIGAGLNAEALTAIVATSTIRLDGKSLTIADMISTFSSRYSKDIQNTIQIGIAEGKTLQQIAKDVRTISNNRTRQQAEAVVRTASNHISDKVMHGVFNEYSKLFKGEEWISVLDNRTSTICASRDGEIYPMNSGPRPPAHYNCRSRRVPIVKDKYSLGIKDTRASMDGQISAKITYEQWLKTQPISIQNEVLGKTRAELFRKGGVSLDRFVDKSGKTYTLDQLRAKDLLK